MLKLTASGFMAFLITAFLALGPATAASPIPLDKSDKAVAKVESPEHLVKVKGCHGQPAYHWVNKWGKKAWHWHGNYCKPHHAKKQPTWGGHCHKKWKKHWHQGHGNKWHKHAGQNCWYKSGKSGYKGGSGCIKIGQVWICG